MYFPFFFTYMLRQSLDGIEALFDQIEDFIEEYLHESEENNSTRSCFRDVKITNEYVCIPIHSLECFSKKHQKEFKKNFPTIDLPEKTKGSNTYWVIMPRDYCEEDTSSSSQSGKRKKN